MSEFKGTPGPWVVDESRHDGSINRLEGEFRHIAMVSQYRIKPGDREENEANAKLIAVSPEMLALLNDLSNWLVCGCIATPEDMAQSFAPYLEAIDALIAKATE